MSMTNGAVRLILDLTQPHADADVYVSLPLGVEVRRLERGRYLITRTNDQGQTVSATPVYGDRDLLETLADIFGDERLRMEDVRQLGWPSSAA